MLFGIILSYDSKKYLDTNVYPDFIEDKAANIICIITNAISSLTFAMPVEICLMSVSENPSIIEVCKIGKVAISAIDNPQFFALCNESYLLVLNNHEVAQEFCSKFKGFCEDKFNSLWKEKDKLFEQELIVSSKIKVFERVKDFQIST